MNGSSNVLVLGVTGQVGKRVATNLKRKKATLSVGSRRKANLKELADQFGASRFIDLDDPRTFDQALKNVTSIFLITGYTVDMIYTATFCRIDKGFTLYKHVLRPV